ncbi:hypothetical protein FNV43_RR06353 [Rhamnella rubrinervis]|uniref:Uncharacterized protein n=1 Tax=Rhamnella rubrinervis TaxID=2594499 RepID=A0A8K0HDR6_9ROSA|nr:hypothetical protein FNV43_RR06353 [Rhamnella rubrinervis]
MVPTSIPRSDRDDNVQGVRRARRACFRLPPSTSSIGSFTELARQFMTQLARSAKPRNLLHCEGPELRRIRRRDWPICNEAKRGELNLRSNERAKHTELGENEATEYSVSSGDPIRHAAPERTYETGGKGKSRGGMVEGPRDRLRDLV